MGNNYFFSIHSTKLFHTLNGLDHACIYFLIQVKRDRDIKHTMEHLRLEPFVKAWHSIFLINTKHQCLGANLAAGLAASLLVYFHSNHRVGDNRGQQFRQPTAQEQCQLFIHQPW
jgi:hypothetical protein